MSGYVYRVVQMVWCRTVEDKYSKKGGVVFFLFIFLPMTSVEAIERVFD